MRMPEATFALFHRGDTFLKMILLPLVKVDSEVDNMGIERSVIYNTQKVAI